MIKNLTFSYQTPLFRIVVKDFTFLSLNQKSLKTLTYYQILSHFYSRSIIVNFRSQNPYTPPHNNHQTPSKNRPHIALFRLFHFFTFSLTSPKPHSPKNTTTKDHVVLKEIVHSQTHTHNHTQSHFPYLAHF